MAIDLVDRSENKRFDAEKLLASYEPENFKIKWIWCPFSASECDIRCPAFVNGRLNKTGYDEWDNALYRITGVYCNAKELRVEKYSARG